MTHPKEKLTIIGGGILGALEGYFAYLEATRLKQQIRTTVYEKNHSMDGTTAFNIVPSLTPDEILSVVPRGNDLIDELTRRFDNREKSGIRVDDVDGLNESEIASAFKRDVVQYGQDDDAHNTRTTVLLELGKKSMELWQQIYDEGDQDLKDIMVASNFNPCREPNEPEKTILHDGYRIDLIFKIPGAKTKAEGMIASYKALGYSSCRILSPSEVEASDPYLADFCKQQSEEDDSGERHWKNDAVAIWRPGGCLNTQIFLPKLYEYLRQKSGTYVNDEGIEKDCFRLKFDRQVTEVAFDPESNKRVISGLRFFNSTELKRNNHQFESSDYVICPGEAVGTLREFGFKEPTFSGFAGPTLLLNINIPEEMREQYADLNHCMEVHQEGVVLAWQVKYQDGRVSVGVGGTKAFYAGERPDINQAFTKNNLLQLNIINEVLPDLISLALGRTTNNESVSQNDLDKLEADGIAVRWVGTRAVAYDGFPTLGPIYDEAGNSIENARCTTHAGSGGVSFGPALVKASRLYRNVQEGPEEVQDDLGVKVAEFSSSSRSVVLQ